MGTLRIESADHCTDTAGIAQLPDDAWLAALLAAYSAHAVTPPPDSEIWVSEIRGHLKHVEFAAIVAAIECARPASTGHAEVRLYQDWIAVNAGGSPLLYAAWFNLGIALARAGDPDRAAVAYGKARELNPTFHPAAVNLGLALEVMGQTDAALRTWESSIQTNESRTMLLNHRGRLMECLGRLGEAEATLRTSLLTDPAQPDVASHFLHIRQKTCRWPVLAADIPGLPPAELLRHSGPLASLALTDDVDMQRELTASWISRKMPPAPTRLSRPEGYRHSRIRVGYMSSDFCRHAMSYLVAELFERHDRSRFEIFGYCATLEDGSDIRRRVLAAFDHCRIIRDLSDEQAARLIREDEIDILIDLNGLTAHTRLAVLRWRPAPIQATYLGFVGPVPLPELDYLLCDDFVIPPSQAAAYRPTPLRIARIYQANDSKRAIGRPLVRRDVGLPDDRFVFCCFSNHYKITEAIFAAWMSILRQADQAVLWLTADDPLSQANLRDSAAHAGVAPERILFIERSSPELYMSRLRLADLFLDTFPYNAGTVASDAIRMQLPLLTLAGTSFASRMAGALLDAIGAQQGIVTSLPEYVAAATTLATDKNAYASYKRHFTYDVWMKTIGNIAVFTADFEATLTQLMCEHADHRLIMAHKERSSMTISDGVIAGNSRSADNGLEEFDTSRVAMEDFALVELIPAAESMTRSGKAKIGLELYELWLRHHPTDPLRYAAYFNYGTLLSQAGHPDQAATAFVDAIRLAPTFLPAYINAGLALERLGRLSEAVNYWRYVVETRVSTDGDCIGNKVMALRQLARVFKTAGDIRHSEDALRQCLDIDPHQRDVIQQWIAVREMQCEWPAIAPWGKLTQPRLMAAIAPLTVAIHTNDPMFQLAHAWRHSYERERSLMPRTVGRWIPHTTAKQRPLRVGYVSSDLREHAIGFLTAELFELHDRDKVEVYAYYSGQVGPDNLRARIREACDHWRDVVGWSYRRVARQIVNDEIDILIDLGGHTGDTPHEVFALRPAPVIANWLGYPGSMGTAHHQYIIADETIIPPAYEKYYSERVVRLPCYQPTDRKRTVAGPRARREVGLSDGSMVYCCFNGLQKITPAVFGCWMAILARVPRAILWLLSCDAATDERLRQQASNRGILPNRLVFAAPEPNAEHLARYPLADLFLDTWPYGAHTTASDALWMGVPVLTMTGHSFASRVCASLVRAAGLPELVCDSPEAYVDYAVDLGDRPDKLLASRHRLQVGRDCCTLFDMPRLVSHLEALYEQMWDEYMSGRIPDPDLTNLAVYDEIGQALDHEAARCTDLGVYERQYATAIAYRDGISPIPPDRRLWPEPAACPL